MKLFFIRCNPTLSFLNKIEPQNGYTAYLSLSEPHAPVDNNSGLSGTVSFQQFHSLQTPSKAKITGALKHWRAEPVLAGLGCEDLSSLGPLCPLHLQSHRIYLEMKFKNKRRRDKQQKIIEYDINFNNFGVEKGN